MERALLEASSVGIAFAVSVLMGLGLGMLADENIGTDPWGIVVGGIMGFAAGCLNLVRMAKSVFRNNIDS